MHWTGITLVACCCMLHGAVAAPQFVSFKDGKVGVNFGGYHASAGLGGLLTGDTAHGGLSASAGTPWGQQAAAGLDGTLDGRTSGVAYAGAQANADVGASAVLGGTAGEKGFAGSESHGYAKTATGHTISGHALSTTVNEPPPPPAVAAAPRPNVQFDNDNGNNIAIQKIKPSKKKHHYTFIKSQKPVAAVEDELPVEHTKHVVKSVETTAAVNPPPPYHHHPVTKEVNSSVHFNSGGVVQSALNIPIGILRSLQESLGQLRVDKTVSYSAHAHHA